MRVTAILRISVTEQPAKVNSRFAIFEWTQLRTFAIGKWLVVIRRSRHVLCLTQVFCLKSMVIETLQRSWVRASQGFRLNCMPGPLLGQGTEGICWLWPDAARDIGNAVQITDHLHPSSPNPPTIIPPGSTVRVCVCTSLLDRLILLVVKICRSIACRADQPSFVDACANAPANSVIASFEVLHTLLLPTAYLSNPSSSQNSDWPPTSLYDCTGHDKMQLAKDLVL